MRVYNVLCTRATRQHQHRSLGLSAKWGRQILAVDQMTLLFCGDGAKYTAVEVKCVAHLRKLDPARHSLVHAACWAFEDNGDILVLE